jgi:hypothetical protein
MSSRRSVCCFAFAALLAVPAAWGAFNYAQYNPGNLDEILAQPRPESGTKVLAPQKLRFEIVLVAYAVGCDTGFLKRTMIMLGAQKQTVDTLPVSKCIKVKTAKGQTTSLYIQDRVAEYLPKEVPLGTTFNIFGDLLFLGKDGPGILINEFQNKKQ